MTMPTSPSNGGSSRRSSNNSRARSYYRGLRERFRKACAGPLMLWGQIIPLAGFVLFLPTMFLLDSEQVSDEMIRQILLAQEQQEAQDSVKEFSTTLWEEDKDNTEPDALKLKGSHVAPPVGELDLQQVDGQKGCEPGVGPPVHMTLLVAFAAGGLLDSRSFKRVMAMV